MLNSHVELLECRQVGKHVLVRLRQSIVGQVKLSETSETSEVTHRHVVQAFDGQIETLEIDQGGELVVAQHGQFVRGKVEISQEAAEKRHLYVLERG